MEHKLHKTTIDWAIRLFALFLIMGCTNQAPSTTVPTSLSATTSASSLQGGAATNIDLVILDSSGNQVFTGSSPSLNVNLISGSNYTFVLSSPDVDPSTPVTFKVTQLSQVNLPSTTSTMILGNNSYTPSVTGNVIMSFSFNSSEASNYQLSISCAKPTLTASSLKPAGISVTGKDTNYTYSAAGVVAHANGQPPYKCAWDFTGTGIRDTDFSDCGTPVTNVSNYVGTRNVGVIVQDACNTAIAVSAPVFLDYSMDFANLPPASAAAIQSTGSFLWAQTSNAAGTAIGDPSLDKIYYMNLAPSSMYNRVYQSSNSSFVITGSQQYTLSTSQPITLTISLANINDTTDGLTGTGTIDASNATVSVTYTTDENGDERGAQSLSSMTMWACTTSGVNIAEINPAGFKCGEQSTGPTDNPEVAVAGNFSCTSITNATASVTIIGGFAAVSAVTLQECNGGGHHNPGGPTDPVTGSPSTRF